MTKLEMAHDWAMKHGNDLIYKTVEYAWKYADAMQAEAEKRNDMERPAVLQDEWQPDWSVAPVWANYWMVAPNGVANWLSNHPSSDPLIAKAWSAPLFGFQGSWENSLRKRP